MKTDFKPEIWPEDEPPEESEEYKECEICTEKSRIIWGEGSRAGRAAIILDNPGEREDKYKNGYVCGTRQTLQKALSAAGIQPSDVYLTYLLKCRPKKSYDKPAVRNFSRPFLIRQIEGLEPRFLLCLGDVAVRAMFEDEGASVKEMRKKWHTLLGRPCMVSYHPLAVRRRPSLAPIFAQDFDMLAEALRRSGPR